MAANAWWIVVIIVASIIALFWVFRWQSSRNISKIEQKKVPAPLQIVVGPKDVEKQPDSVLRGIERSKGKWVDEGNNPLTLKTVVEFVDTVYIGETYILKTFIFNTAKDAEDADSLIKDLMDKDQTKNQPQAPQKKFETDSLYAKNQEPVRVKVEIAAPNFTVAPASRILEVPAGAVATSSHLIAPNNSHPPSSIISKVQPILVSFDQILEANISTHLGSIETQVKIGRGYIPPEINSELITQTKIRYFSSVAGATAALLTGVSIVVAILTTIGVL
jgi:hypothetical protein